MAGRKPIDDDRKRKAVTMNVSNKDLKILDNFIRKNGLSSRSYFLYRVVYGYINGNYVKKSNDIVIPNEYDYMQQDRKFKHSKNGIDWLLKDEKAQEDYLSDKRVVMDMTPRFFLQFLNGMMKIQSNEYWLYCKNDVLFIAGEEDPVSCGLSEVLKRYRRAGARITKKIISGYRHDVLHDSCKEKVFQCIEKFL